MKKILFILMFAFALRASAQIDAFNGYCTQGSYPATVSGLNSSNLFQNLIPQCTVTVYLTGTTNLATIYADAISTPLTNPFRASTKAQWLFFAQNNVGYDVVMSGGIPPLTYTIPVTLTDLKIGTGGGGGGGGGVTNFSAGNLPPLFTTTVTNSSTTPNLAFNLSTAPATSIFGNATNAGGNPFYFLYSCTGLLNCAYSSSTNTLTLNVPNSSSLSVTATYPILVNGGAGPVSSGTANVSCATCDIPPVIPIQMYPVPPDTNQGVFIPFTQCTINIDNATLAKAQCVADAGTIITTPGGIFNHLAHPSILYSVPDPTILAGINPANITAVYAMAWLDASGSVGYTFACSATGVGAFNVPWSIPNGSQTSASFPVSGANIGSAQCQQQQNQSVLGDYGGTATYQSGLWVEYTGSPVLSTNYINVEYPLSYTKDNNILTVNQFWPDFMYPRLFANLPGPVKYYQSPAGWITYLVSDNSTVTVGQPCVGTGTPTGPPYSLCTANGSQWIYDGTFGGSGPPAVSSVSNVDGSLTITPTAGAVVSSINPNHTNTWNVYQVFEAGIVLDKSNSPVSTNGDEGFSGACFLSSGFGLTPHWGLCSGNSSWSALTNPTSNLSLSMGSNTTTFSFSGATGSSDLFRWADAVSNTGTGILGHFTTASGSSETPWCADANGVGWCVNATGVLQGIGASSSHGAVIPEGTPIPGVTSKDVITADATTHELLKNVNNGGALVIPGTSTTAATPGNCATYAVNGYDLVPAPCGAGGSTIVASAEVVAFSATPTFSSNFNVSRIVLTGNITSFTIGGSPSDGQSKTLCFKQGAGPYTVAPPAAVHGFFTIGTINADWNCQSFVYDNTDLIWQSVGPGTINQ